MCRPGMDDGRAPDNGNLAAFFPDLEDLLCDLGNQGLARALRGDSTVHELKRALLAGTLGVGDTDSLLPDNDKVAFPDLA